MLYFHNNKKSFPSNDERASDFDNYDFSEYERRDKWNQQGRVILGAFAGVTVFVIALVAALVWLNKWNIRRRSQRQSTIVPPTLSKDPSIRKSVNYPAADIVVGATRPAISAKTSEIIVNEEIIRAKES